MLREVSFSEAVMATLRGEAAYVFFERKDDGWPQVDPVGVYKINELLKDGDKYRYIWDEPVDVEIGTSKDLPFAPDKSELESFEPAKLNHKPGPKPKIDTGKLMALYNAGWDDAKIADELNVNIKTVRKYLREAREDGEVDD